MKQRIAFFHDGNDSFDPEKQLAVSPQSVTITSLPAARQEKLTFTFDELPAEVCMASSPHVSMTSLSFADRPRYILI